MAARMLAGIRTLAALMVIGTFVLPLDWIELRLAVLGRTKFTWVAAMIELRKPGLGADELFQWFMLFMLGFIFSSCVCVAGHPIKAAVWNIVLLFFIADDAILKPFQGVKLWFVLGYDVCWVATLVMLLTGLIGCCSSPKATLGVPPPAAQSAEKAGSSATTKARKSD